MADFYQALITVFFWIILGVLFGKNHKKNLVAVKEILATPILLIALPVALLLSTFSVVSENAREGLSLLAWGAGIGVIATVIPIVLITLFFYKTATKTSTRIYKFSLTFTSIQFLGFPLVSSVFENDGMAVYTGFTVMWMVFLLTYGMKLKPKENTTYKRGGMMSVAIAVWVLTTIVAFMPETNISAVDITRSGLLGGLGGLAFIATPLSLIYIGMLLSGSGKLREMWSRNIAIVCMIRLIVIPVTAWGIMILAGVPSVVTGVMVLLLALPVSSVLGLWFDTKKTNEKNESGEIVTLSTVLAMITVPLLVAILSLF